MIGFEYMPPGRETNNLSARPWLLRLVEHVEFMKHGEPIVKPDITGQKLSKYYYIYIETPRHSNSTLLNWHELHEVQVQLLDKPLDIDLGAWPWRAHWTLIWVLDFEVLGVLLVEKLMCAVLSKAFVPLEHDQEWSTWSLVSCVALEHDH